MSIQTIVLIPVKNEDWIIEHTLRNIAPHVDLVLIADQQSTDRTREICSTFSNVGVITNPYSGHSNEIRWKLLDEARTRMVSRAMSNEHRNKAVTPIHQLYICIDADEMISPLAITHMKQLITSGRAVQGDAFRFHWIQLWKHIDTYMEEGVWKNNFKNIAFVDHPGVNEYKKEYVINDHTSRIPDSHPSTVIDISYPLLHFHYVAWDRSQLKQAWYRCTELIAGKRNAKRINNTYRVTLFNHPVTTLPVPPEWSNGLHLPTHLSHTTSSWHYDALIGFFNTYGIEFFEDLQIWHIPQLREEFIRRTGRSPISKTYPAWLVRANDIRHAITRLITTHT